MEFRILVKCVDTAVQAGQVLPKNQYLLGSTGTDFLQKTHYLFLPRIAFTLSPADDSRDLTVIDPVCLLIVQGAMSRAWQEEISDSLAIFYSL